MRILALALLLAAPLACDDPAPGPIDTDDDTATDSGGTDPGTETDSGTEAGTDSGGTDSDTGTSASIETCAELQAAFSAEYEAISTCTQPSDCGTELTGTSCGCTRNWVARADADTTRFYDLRG